MGGEQTLTINSNLPWRLKNNTPWIVISQPNGLSSGKVTFTVQRNRTRDERHATIIAYITDSSEATLNLTQQRAESGEPIIYHVKTDGNPDASGETWEEATTLDMAMENAGDGDVIRMAAGTYTPTALLTSGELEEEKTFEIHSNFTVEGGYPANATTGAVPDPLANPTVLSGNLGAGVSAYHVVTVTAGKSTQNQAVLKNLTISDGITTKTVGSVRRLVGGALIDVGMGGGLVVGRSNLMVLNCIISGNEGCHSGGMHIYAGANVIMEDCLITSNRVINNGGGIWNSGGVLYMNRCNIVGNISGQQAGGLYSIDASGVPSINRIYNSTFSDNDNTQTNINRSGGGAYIREGSDAVFVNCTFTGNKAGYGGGIMGYGTAAYPSHTICISCTITGNKANGTAGGGGVIVYNANGAITLYNTIVSGNESISGSAEAGLGSGVDASLLKVYTSIIGVQLFDNEGSGVGGWNFNAATMLGSLGLYNGGTTRTFPLITGANNPAITQGMTVAELKQQASALNPVVADDIVSADQNGTARTGRSIGASTAQ